MSYLRSRFYFEHAGRRYQTTRRSDGMEVSHMIYRVGNDGLPAGHRVGRKAHADVYVAAEQEYQRSLDNAEGIL